MDCSPNYPHCHLAFLVTKGILLQDSCGLLRYIRRRQWHPTPVLLSGKFHGLRSLLGYSPWDHEESDTTEQLEFSDFFENFIISLELMEDLLESHRTEFLF